jgi:CRISPR-associated exonuclease Cas4
MADGLVALLVMILFIASAALFARRGPRVRAGDGQGLPAELRGAEIAFAEVTLRSHRRRLVARLDRAYRTSDGLQLVELKTRAHDAVYMSDVIELSVQRIVVEDEAGEQVSGEAWVVVQNSRSGARSPHKVRLLGVREISAMRERYSDVVRGKVARPNPSRSLSQCTQCSHNDRCSATFGDRVE